MKLYSGIDLHSNNAVVNVINENDKILYQKKLPCELGIIMKELQPYQADLEGVAVESTFNWYWLVDGLMEQNYEVHLVNTAAVKQYEGLKHTDDNSDAFWLAHLLRLGILPTGYIYPKEQRAVRDLARKRSQLVQQRTNQILSLQTLYIRNTGKPLSCDAIKKLKLDDIKNQFTDPNIVLAMESNLTIYEALRNQIRVLENAIEKQIKLEPQYQHLMTIDGIGKILALTIMLETGDISRFDSVGTMPLTAVVWIAINSVTARKRGQEILKTVTNIYHGLLSKRQISAFATMNTLSAIIRENQPKPNVLLH